MPDVSLARRFSSANTETQTKNTQAASRTDFKNLSGENRDLYNALSKDQKEDLRSGKIRSGYNEWMVRMAVGEPFFKTVQNPRAKKEEIVWIYTRRIESSKQSESRIIDPVSGWPSIRRVTEKKTCEVGDFFVVFDRGVVTRVSPGDSKKVYGPCKIESTEEIIPQKKKKN